jgi:hypothetical protein
MASRSLSRMPSHVSLTGHPVILGNAKTFKGIGFVCFIDILGFAHDILTNWRNPTSNPLEKIIEIKSHMPDSELEENKGGDTRRRYVCRVSTISDSITICWGSDNLIVSDLVLGLEVVLGNLLYTWSTCINAGYTIRGAIDFGDIYWDEGNLIGPAFINAYRLECEVAKNSRVVVSSNLNTFLKNLITQHKSTLVDHLLQSFRKDVDGYIIVNPSILYRSEPDRTALIENLKKMRDAAPTGVVREKYNPLIGMLSNRIKDDLTGHDLGNY